MKVKAKRKKKCASNYDYLNTIKVSDHHLVIVIDDIDDNRKLAIWRFEHKGKFYGSDIGFEIKPGYTLQAIKEAVNRLIDQQMIVRTTFGDFGVCEIKGDELCG